MKVYLVYLFYIKECIVCAKLQNASFLLQIF